MASQSQHLRLVFHDNDTHRPISGIRVVAAAHCLDGTTVPLGLLDTDAGGYVSFDLLLLVSRSDIDSLWVAPLADLQQKTNVLATGAVAGVPGSRVIGTAISSAIFVEIGLTGPLASLGATPALPSVQNATIDDWRFSPSSFVINAPLPLGQDKCEQLLPSTLPLSEFRFRQMIRGAEFELQIIEGAPRILKTIRVRTGTVLEYKTTWNSLGHSLGQIIYSLPLAPCEQVNVAVINWSRKDQASRDEDLTVNEQLLHNLHRDRSIEESVRASVDEWQRGGNVTGGTAASATLSFGMASAALGGSYSTSAGNRELAANTAQQLSDNIAQATTSIRSLHSTVIKSP